MPPLPYAALTDRLSTAFDDPATRNMPLAGRQKITDALESTLREAIGIVGADGFVEIGAYEAAFSREMRAAHPEAPVLAFEANPRVHAHFRDAVAADGVTYLNRAVDAQAGTVSFYIPEVIAGAKMPHAGRMGSLHQVGLRDSETTEVSVEATTLDAAAGAAVAGERLCLWIDVEGAIDRVLAGGAETLARSAMLYCEVETRPVWKEQALAESVTADIAGAGFTMVARDCQKWFQYNALFVRDGFARNPDLVALAERYATIALELFERARAARG